MLLREAFCYTEENRVKTRIVDENETRQSDRLGRNPDLGRIRKELFFETGVALHPSLQDRTSFGD